jgi:multidrug resistance protein, MATE family
MENLNAKIVRLALPFLVANVSIPLLGLVDTAVLGRLESEVYLGAIALGGMVFNFIFWGFSFLKMGTTGFTSQALGRGDVEYLNVIFQRGAIIAICLGCTILLLQYPIWKLAIVFIHGSELLIEEATIYFSIRVFSAPAVFLMYVLYGWFLGRQKAMYVLYMTIMENGLNIVFNLVFIYAFNMRAGGVALGTVCAQYITLIVCVVLVFKKFGDVFRIYKWSEVLNKMALFKFFKVNIDIMIRTFALMFAFAFFTVKSSSYNDVLLATNMILLQFLTFFSYIVDGFAHAGETLAGFYYGAKNKIGLKQLIQRLFAWGFAIALFFSVAYALFYSSFVELFTNQQLVIDAAMPFRFWLSALPLLSFAAFLWDGVFIGLMATSYLRNAMLMALGLFFIPTYYLLEPHFESRALWIAMLSFMFARGVVLWAYSFQLSFRDK